MPDRFSHPVKSHAIFPDTARAALIAVGASALLLFVAALTVPRAQAADVDVLKHLYDGDHVLMIRHANAPGFGDPAHIQIGDCSTQRNLDDAGREQARAIGAWLKDKGVATATMYSSQWCRCLETAALMDFGDVRELPALNSFYERPQDREGNLRALREFLAARADVGMPIVLVTHQVVISALTDAGVSSGEGVIVNVKDERRYALQARVDFVD